MKIQSMLRNQKGSLFVTTAIASFAMVLMASYMYELTSTEVHSIHQMLKSSQAQQLAEAGLSRAINTLAASWAARSSDSNFPTTSLGAGTYNASFSTVSSRNLVSCVGTVQGVSRTVSAEVSAPVTAALKRS